MAARVIREHFSITGEEERTLIPADAPIYMHRETVVYQFADPSGFVD